MILYISTSDQENIKLALRGSRVQLEKTIPAARAQSEKLLLGIKGLLAEAGQGLEDLRAIEVDNKGGSFTSLRIGILTANALAYALDIPIYESGKKRIPKKFKPLEPKYDSDPVIGEKKK